MELCGNPVRPHRFDHDLAVDRDSSALGELQYQLQLQNSNPEEFKALLERNGIKYDPHYIRGGRGQRRPTDGFF